MTDWSVVDGSASGPVTPLDDCPHVQACFDVPESSARTIDASGACSTCNSKEENWLCLVCFNTGCSRFVQSHGVTHANTSGHSIALSLRDGNIWCYSCDQYVANARLNGLANFVNQLVTAALSSEQPDESKLEGDRTEMLREFVRNARERDWSTVDASVAGPVNPKTDCSHLQVAFVPVKKAENVDERSLIDTEAPCSGCGDISENWLCLTCYNVNCSRFKNGHAASHFETTFHPLALSFSDFSVWCYCCDSYVKHESLFEVLDLAHLNKHGFRASQAKKPGKLTGHVKEEDVKEFFDEPDALREKVHQLAELIKSSNYTVVYTGAGISTSAKLPDYRGPQGVWTLREKGQVPTNTVSIDQAQPTPTHMAIVKLAEDGIVKFVVSTNVDGLHRRSGLPSEKLSELHGNSYLEVCSACKKEYLRNHTVGSVRRDHLTGAKCDDCGGFLKDSIINFEEKLPERELERTYIEAKQSDLAIVLGSSMRVKPANLFPSFAKENGGKLVIVNLQKTLYHNQADLVIHGRMDEVLEMLMQELGVEIPKYEVSHDSVIGPKS